MQICEEKTVHTHAQDASDHHATKNDCYMVDEQGKEVPITSSMVQDVCIELLKLCRTVNH
ncbi:PA1571 family protein [Acinetobacter sp. MD2(2019)]|uniref:PA1571 family protein n=1 Tax=Acinetobacter sp. MD2(2019) TaxID=2605273 RepID=UPI002D1F5CCD|nr:PA1571 family protein [Acinetobacter sp. MD2(2019)]MEB3753887.1 hypothetical protein [Acinetobacter sp. MD2(2019)]